MKNRGFLMEKRGVFDEKAKMSQHQGPKWNIPGPKSLWGSLRVPREVGVWNIPLCEFPNNDRCGRCGN